MTSFSLSFISIPSEKETSKQMEEFASQRKQILSFQSKPLFRKGLKCSIANMTESLKKCAESS